MTQKLGFESLFEINIFLKSKFNLIKKKVMMDQKLFGTKKKKKKKDK